MIKKRLQGLAIIVTGAGRSLGRAISLKLAGEGAHIITSAINSELCDELTAKIITAGGSAKSFPADVSKESDVHNLIKAAVKEYGRLDVMVANAGTAVHPCAVVATAEECEQLFEMNVLGAFLCDKEAAFQMLKQKSGKIINCCSTTGRSKSWTSAAYEATKHTLRGFTRSLAMELAPNGVSINSFCPGTVSAAHADSIDIVLSEIMGLKSGDANKMLAAAIPSGRLHTQNEVTSLISYLSSGESDYITGQSIATFGG